MLLCLIPKVPYRTLDDGLPLFVQALGFSVLHRDDTLAVLGREGLKVHLVADPVLAAMDRPELSIETDCIEAEHSAVAARRPGLLHPNLREVTQRPWGAREFAVLDATGVCVVFRQWP